MSGLLGAFASGKQAAKAQKEAAKEYIKYQEGQRRTFLKAPENLKARETLNTFMSGNQGYDEDTLQSMRAGAQEDYGRAFRDFNRNIAKTGVRPGGAYTPGNRMRSERLQAENIGTRRAETLRAIKKENADLAYDNQRWAFSQSPTYSAGMPATPNIGYQVFRDKNAQGPNWTNLLAGVGDAAINSTLSAGGSMGGPIGAGSQGAQQSYNNPSYGTSSGQYY